MKTGAVRARARARPRVTGELQQAPPALRVLASQENTASASQVKQFHSCIFPNLSSGSRSNYANTVTKTV